MLDEIQKGINDILREYEKQSGEFELLNIVIPYEEINKVSNNILKLVIDNIIVNHGRSK